MQAFKKILLSGINFHERNNFNESLIDVLITKKEELKTLAFEFLLNYLNCYEDYKSQPKHLDLITILFHTSLQDFGGI